MLHTPVRSEIGPMARRIKGFMKEGIHPDYAETTITCACGTVIQTRSTRKDIKTEICSKCHPFMTGKQKIIDTAGRVDRFKKRYAAQEASKEASKEAAKEEKAKK
jgi:large subunit ribosomal protein L31